MSKYPVTYLSGSKKSALNIEDMTTPHLMNAWRKLGDTDPDSPAILYMVTELVNRGGKLDRETERWVFPEKLKPEDADAAADRKYHERVEDGRDPITGRDPR